MRKTPQILMLVTLLFTLVSCSSGAAASMGAASQQAVDQGSDALTSVDQQANAAITSTPISVEYDDEDLDSSVAGDDASYIELKGDSITLEGNGARVNGSIVTITSAGMYSVSGTLNDGQIVVDTLDPGTVRLVLNGADIACSTSAPIYVANAEKTVITLADGTDNHVSDGSSYVSQDADSEPDAAIFSKDDLTINGNGSLTVNANYANGIESKDDLKVLGGNITVNAVNDGIRGRDSIAVSDGVIIVNADGDGMQSNNDEDAEKGYISIEGGTIDIAAGLDGIQAETRLSISEGDITIVSGGGSANASISDLDRRPRDAESEWDLDNEVDDASSTGSAKGLKAGVDVTITGGRIQVDSSDDAVHSNDILTIEDGELVLASGDDGVHSDNSLTINGGETEITTSYEGIESAAITINQGNIHLVARDDGINAVSANDDAALFGQAMPKQGGFESGDSRLDVNGGYIFVDALGDGVDVNGSIGMTDGILIINGPTAQNNGPLDFLGDFSITGGLLVAVGSSGMAQSPSASSTQYSVMHIFPSTQEAGAMIHIETDGGEDILTFVPKKEYQSLVLSSAELANGATYDIYVGGSSTGTAVDGLYSDGTYTPGTQIASFTISSIVTGEGGGDGGFRGGGRRPR